jgi:hypothetical protein
MKKPKSNNGWTELLCFVSAYFTRNELFIRLQPDEYFGKVEQTATDILFEHSPAHTNNFFRTVMQALESKFHIEPVFAEAGPDSDEIQDRYTVGLIAAENEPYAGPTLQPIKGRKKVKPKDYEGLETAFAELIAEMYC